MASKSNIIKTLLGNVNLDSTIVYVFYCINTCYVIRRHFSIESKLISFAFTLSVAALTYNLKSYIHSNVFLMFNDDKYPTICIIFWTLFNIFPFDLVFKLSNVFYPLINGLTISLDTFTGIDIGKMLYKNSLSVVFFAVVFAFSRYIGFFAFGRLTNRHFPGNYVVVFQIFTLAIGYFLTNSIDDYLLWSGLTFHECAKLTIILYSVFFEFLKLFMDQDFFTTTWTFFTGIFEFLLPYYGKTWIHYTIPSDN